MASAVQRLRHENRRDTTVIAVSSATPAVGGAALLAGETDGFATDFSYATDASRVAVKVAGVVTSYGLDAFFANGGFGPKLVYDVSGSLVWSPHNMYIQSATPITRSVTTVVGQDYTVSVIGSGSLTGSAGASGVATQASPLTYTATTTTSTFTLAGSLTRVQMNRGPVATAHLTTTASARYGLAIDYDPVTHAARGLLSEPAATNLLLNNFALSTQSVTVTAVAHTLSFIGTGTITLSGVSTAGPLVGTDAATRVILTFTPTAGALTLTVSGTVTRAQLETGTVATSFIPTFAASATRAGDGYNIATPASINYSATAGSWWVEQYHLASVGSRLVGYTTGSVTPMGYSGTAFQVFEGTTLSKVFTVLNVVSRSASAFASGDRALTAGGLAVATDSGATTNLFNPGGIFLGVGAGSTNPLNGYIRKITYRPRRITNSEMVTETT